MTFVELWMKCKVPNGITGLNNHTKIARKQSLAAFEELQLHDQQNCELEEGLLQLLLGEALHAFKKC